MLFIFVKFIKNWKNLKTMKAKNYWEDCCSFTASINDLLFKVANSDRKVFRFWSSWWLFFPLQISGYNFPQGCPKYNSQLFPFSREIKSFLGQIENFCSSSQKRGMNKVMPKFEKNIQFSLTIRGGYVLEKFEILEYQNHRFMHKFGRNCILFSCVRGFPPCFLVSE